MTVKQTVSTIRKMGMSCVWLADYKEYRVNFPLYDTRRHGDDSVYYTNDSEDAIATAMRMKEYK